MIDIHLESNCNEWNLNPVFQDEIFFKNQGWRIWNLVGEKNQCRKKPKKSIITSVY